MGDWLAHIAISLLAAAAPQAYDVIEVRRTTHLGASDHHRLELNDKGYFYDGLGLPMTNALFFGAAVKTLRPQPGSRPAKTACAAGGVELTRRQGKLVSREMFCLNDSRAKEVQSALDTLKSQARMGLVLRK